MAGKLNYRVQAELDTKKFKIGANELRREFASLKSGILGFSGALGASFAGLSVLSKMKDVAVNLNVARATLKNTSADFAEYSNNLQFVDRLSKDYKQDIITLTSSFAKFHAASQGTNFSLQQQKEMFEGLTKAAAFYHLSTERTENMLLAVEQIMSKNKVTAEELRRQLGNVMPGAFNKMGQAAIDMGYAGVKSMADFEKAMKDGKIGADLLYKFVQNLNEETKDIDLNSLQLQMNELHNAFVRFTENSNFEKWFAGVVTQVTHGLDFIANNIQAIADALKVVIGLWAGGKAIKGLDRLLYTISQLTVQFKGWKALFVSLFDTIHYYLLVIGDALKTLVGIPGLLVGSAAIVEGRFLKLGKSIKDVNKEIEELIELKEKVEKDNDKSNSAAKLEERARADFEKAQKYFAKHPREEYERNKTLADTSEEVLALAGTMGAQAAAGLRQQVGEAKRFVREYQAMLDLRDEAVQTLTDVALLMGKGTIKTDSSVTGSTNGGDDVTDFEKAVEKYRKAQKELDNQYQAGSITLKEYTDETASLTDKSWKAITAFDNYRGEIEKLDSTLKPAAERLEKAFGENGLRKSFNEITDITNDYYKELVKQNALLGNNYISEKDYNSALLKASESAVEAMQGIKNLETVLSLLDPITQQIVGSILKTYQDLYNAEKNKEKADFAKRASKALETPDLAARWAYKETTPEFYQRMAKAYASKEEEIAKLVEEARNDISKTTVEKLKELEKALEDAGRKAQDFKDMADITEWALEIKSLRKEFGENLFNGISQTASAMDRLTDGIEKVKKTMSDADATAWDKFLVILNEIVQLMDTLCSLTETYKALSEASRQLNNAKNAEELKALSEQYFTEGALIGVKRQEMALSSAAASQASKNAAANLAEQSSLAGEAVAGATASGAKMAFPYNLIAIAVGLSAVMAALSNIKKFAGGGIVKGSLHGDRNVVGVNGNEMILNTSQQGRLWGMLNGRNTQQQNTGGNVQFRIEGKDLVGVMRNYESIRRG